MKREAINVSTKGNIITTLKVLGGVAATRTNGIFKIKKTTLKVTISSVRRDKGCLAFLVGPYLIIIY